MKYPTLFPKTIWIVVLALLSIHQLSAYPTSTGDQLWSEFLANPHDHSNIPDNSYAGYMRGEVPIPDYPVVANVLDYGGVGDGVTDNTNAFREAVRAAGMAGGGAVFVPAGTYVVEDVIHLDRSGVVIRGEGMGQTIIQFSNPLESALGSTGYGTSKWNWAGGLLWIGPNSNLPEIRGEPKFQQTTPNGISNGGPGHSWEYWFHGDTLASAPGTHERGSFDIIVDDAANIVPGDTYLVTYDVSQALFEEIGDHPLMQGQDYGSWLEDTASYPFWHWPVEVKAVSGNTVRLVQPLRVAIRPQYNVKVRELGPLVEHSGVEELTIQGQAPLTMGNNASIGWNGVSFNKTLNCWARNVEVLNMQNGFTVSSGKNLSLVGTRIRGDRMMHHGYTCRPTTHDTLYDDFRIELTGGALVGMHGINTEWLSTGNVWSRGYMNQGTFDSHRAISFDMIRTEIELKSNKESRPGGASQAGRFVGRRVAHWNIHINNSDRPDENGLDAKGLYIYQHDQFVRSVLVGIQGAPMCDLPPYAMPSGDKDVIVADHGMVPTQPNLWLAQLGARREREAWVLPDLPIHIAPLAPGDISFPVTINLPSPLNATRVVLEVDGVDIAEDSSAPFAPVWTAAAAGAYTIQFRLEDDQGGTTWSPEQTVTVGSRMIVEDNDPAISGNRNEYFNAPYFSEGRVRHNADWLEYTFVGTRIRVISGSTSGQMKGEVFLNDFGTPVANFAISTSLPESDKLVFDSGPLPNGVHHLRLEETGENLVIDYFLVDSTLDAGSVLLPPKARISVTPDAGVAPLQVSMSAAGSSDPDGSISSYEWDIDGDGTYDYTGIAAQHTFTTWQEHTIRLRVTDNDGLSTISTRTIPVVEPMPLADIVASSTSGSIPLTVDFDASAALPSETFRSITSYEWDFEDDGIFDATGATASKVFSASGQYRVRLRVTDDAARVDEATILIHALNEAPVVTLAESLLQITSSESLPLQIQLSSNVNDDGIPAVPGLSYQWSIVDQPSGANASFDDANGLAPRFTVDQFGTYLLELVADDGDKIGSDEIYVILKRDSSGGYISVAGQVVMEAEGFNRRIAGATGTDWESEIAGTGYSGSGYVSVPNGTTSDEVEPRPTLEYEIDFQQTGSYNVWVRRYAADYGGNSAFFSLNGVGQFQIDNSNSDAGLWVWRKASTKLSVTETGVKHFQLIMREDGYRVDKIILTTSNSTPTGEGPEPSPRDGNEPPTAIILASSNGGYVPHTITFDGSASSDDGELSYAWDLFEDGSIDGTGSEFLYSFTAAGNFSIGLTVTDTEGKSHYTNTFVTTEQLQLSLPPVALGTASPTSGSAPMTVQLDATGSFDPDGSIISYGWDLDSDGLTDVEGLHAEYSLVDGGTYTPVLTVRDDQGIETSVSTEMITLTAPAVSFGDAGQYAIGASSYLGGSGDDEVVAVEIQASGVIVVAANISDANPGSVTPMLLNGATTSTPGSILRLSADGKTVLSVTRFTDRVEDLSLDADDRIYVAAAGDGVLKLDSQAASVLWSHPLDGYGMRIDAANDGRCVALNIVNQSDENGIIYVFGSDASLVGDFPGRSLSQDVAIDDHREQVFLTGYKVDHSGCNPVHVAYLQAHRYDGSRTWTNYGWPGTWLDDCDGDGFVNNMADTRGYRVDYGPDGLLYTAFESAGGNHIFRYDPKILSKSVQVVGGDLFENFTNSLSDHKTVFVKTNPADGAFILAQQLTGRVQNESGWLTNTVRVRYGGITSDESGRVYVWGEAAEGLPLPSHPLFSANSNENVVDPFYPPGASNSGAFVLIADNTFQWRTLLTRPATEARMQGLGVRRLAGEPFPRIAFGGEVVSTSLTHIVDPIQATYGGGASDGFFSVLTGPSGNIPPRPSFTASATAGKAPLAVSVDAASSLDVDGSIVSYEWDWDGDGVWDATGSTAAYNYTSEGSYTLTLRVTDNDGAQAVESKTIAVGNRAPLPSFTMTPSAAVFPFTVSLDASASSDPDDSISSYSWDTNGDGITDASGVSTSFTVGRAGVIPVTLTVTDLDGEESILTLPVTALVGDNRPVSETDGLFVFEAEAMESIDQRSDSTGRSWEVSEDGNGFIGSRYIVFPNVQEAVEPAADAAVIRYSLDSTQSGSVRVWARRLSADGASNSCYWSLGSGGTNTGDNEDSNHGVWHWVSLGTASLGTGIQQLEIYHRESGYQIDRYAVAYDPTWLPVGAGPAATPRTGNEPPVASIAVSASSGTTPFSVTFDGSGSFDSDGSVVSWSWDFDGDGLEDATGANPQFTYLESGTYTVSLLVEDNEGAFAKATTLIDANPNQVPIPVISADPISGNGPLTVAFGGWDSSDPDGTVVAWAWDFDGDGITDATGSSVSHTFIEGGTHEITMQISDDRGATVLETIEVTVINPPTAVLNASTTSGNAPLSIDFNASASSDPENAIVSYEWDFGDGNTASGVSVSYAYPIDGTYTVSLTVTDSEGLTAVDTETITVLPGLPFPIIQASALSGTSPFTVNFDASASTGNITSYTWDFGDGTTATGVTTSYTYEGKGSVTVTLSVEDGTSPTQTATETIVVNQVTQTIPGLLYYEDFEYIVEDDWLISGAPTWSGYYRGWKVWSTSVGGGGDAGRPQDYVAGDISLDTGNRSLVIRHGDDASATDDSLPDQTDTVYVSFIGALSPGTTNFEERPFTFMASNSSNLAINLSGKPGSPEITNQWIIASTDGFANYVGLDRGSGSAHNGADLLIVAKFSKESGSPNYNRVDLWVNPTTTDESTGYIGFSTGDSGVSVFEGIALRSDNDTKSYVDEIRVATNFAAALGAIESGDLVAPSALAATVVSASRIDLSWSDNSANETGFKVQRSETSGGPWTDLTTTPAGTTAYSDTGLGHGTQYFYQVLATSGAGDSAASNEVSATTWTAAEDWRYQYFGQTTNSGDADDAFDYDRDGVLNLIERAFKTNPTVASVSYTPQAGMENVAAEEFLSLTYRRLSGGSGNTGVDYTVDGLIYTVEYNDNLAGTWNSGDITVVEILTDTPEAGVDTVTVRMNAPISVSGMKTGFIRLRITVAP